MSTLSKIEQFRQVKSGIRRNKNYLIVGIDASKKSSVGCFYNIEKGVLLKKYHINHNLEDFQKFTCKIKRIMKINNFQKVIIGIEPTGNYHKPLSEYLKNKGYFVVYVSSVAAKNNRKTINSGRWGKNDPLDAYNVADLMVQGKILFYRDEINKSMDIRKYLLLRQRLMKTKSSLKNRIQNNILACHFPELGNIFKDSDDDDLLILLEQCPSAQQVKDMKFQSFINLFPHSIKKRSKRSLRLMETWQTAKTSVGFRILQSTTLEAKMIARDIKKIKKDISVIDKILTDFCSPNDTFHNLLSLPGFGIFTTSVYKSFLDNIENFNHHRQITKFAGLDIETMSSGNFKGKEKISKKGHSLFRFATCQATNVAVSRHKIIRQMFQDKLKERGNSNESKAKLKIKFAEKIIRAAFVMLKNKVPFNINLFNVPVDDPVLNNVRAF